MTKEQLLEILKQGARIWNEGNIYLLGGVQIPSELIAEIQDQLAVYNTTQLRVIGLKQ